ncbi:MAG: tetratricopeptide repeat protein [bacterium]
MIKFRKKTGLLVFLFILCSFPLAVIASELAYQYFESGISYYDQGNYEKALAEFQKAIREKSDFAQSYYNMAIIFDKQEKFQDAIEAYKKVLQLDPNTGMILENLALDSYLAGNFKDAMYYVKLAESKGKPINKMLENQIWAEYMKGTSGTLISPPWADEGMSKSLRRDIESDIFSLEKELEHKTVTANDLLELGIKYRQIGDIDKAIEILKRAETQDPGNYKILAELGLCSYLNDDVGLFIKYMEKAHDLGYNPSKSLLDLYSQSIPKD